MTRNRIVALCLVLSAVLLFFLRMHTYDEPFQNDLTLYSLIASEMLQGRELYSDLWDHKPE